MVTTIAIGERELQLDESGYLMDINSWDVNVVERLAELEGIELKAEYWKLITAIRLHFERTGQSPLCRDILRDTGFTKAQVYEMFASGHRSAYKLAGLPKPPEC